MTGSLDTAVDIRDLSLEEMIDSGGDHRQWLDPSTGLNRYRVSGVPRDGEPLGSCTASWSSPLGWEAAGSVLDAWRAETGDDPVAALFDTADGVRDRLRAIFGVADCEVVLTPSGTDAVFVVSSVALARGAAHLHHVVVGAGELGSGTLPAAAGDTFTEAPPLGLTDDWGLGLTGLSEYCTAEPVYLRDAAGHALDIDEVDAAASAAVARGVEEPGSTVVLHMVAHSKTGLRAPSVRCVDELVAAHPGRILVLMDAAQGRVAPTDIRRALRKGYVVLFTGSKFYSGPPFSGALLMPGEWADDPGALPVGLDGWVTAVDLPAGWAGARAGAPVRANPGLLLRWESALAEMEAYHAISVERRSGVYHTFAAAMLGTFGPAPLVDLSIPTPPVHELASGLGAFPSVYNLAIRRPDGTRLDAEALSRLHTVLDSEVESPDPAVRRRFHLGQPVALGPPAADQPAVLRVALGARLVREHADRPDAGAAWFRSCAEELHHKLQTAVLTPDLFS